MTQAEQRYAFENVRELQRERLRALEALLDPGTIQQLERRGVAPGWRCMEVGAGGGSIAAWLSARVAPEGSVLATDLDTTVLAELSHPNLEVRVHDVLVDEVPEGEFDLVHMRLVLAWLAEPQVALRRLVAALKPGGWLLAEEMDFVSVAPDPQLDERSSRLFARVVQAHNAVLAERHGFDHGYGRRLLGALSDADLTDLGCEGRVSMWRGDGPGGTVWRLTLAQLREPLIQSGLVTPAEVAAAIALLEHPHLAFQSQITMAAWGRRPVGA
jgi:2-polyprenyl-3-methyl-5-hydroxy-6-metoxy-1,4-benzoquinol methylase